MAEIKWTSGFSVGVPLMDEQHKELIAMINATGGPGGPQQVLDTIGKLFAYAEKHFKAEEDLLRIHHYPELNRQIQEHGEFVSKIAAFCTRDLRDPALCAELNDFLCQWLSRHILEEDMKFKHFLLPTNETGE